MLQKFVATTLVCLSVNAVFAQTDSTDKEEKNPLKISGYADVYYKLDFAKTGANNKTSFTNTHNSFELGMASLKFEKSIGKVSMVADLGFGTRAKEFAYADNGIAQSIKQLYITYAASDKLTITAGSWATHVGYELVDPQLNRNYSMSYMFSYGPFTHTGIKADYKMGNSGIMLGITNPTDQRSTGISPKYIIGQFRTATNNGKLKMYLNYVAGKNSDTSKMNQIDVVATLGITDKFSIGYDGTIASYKLKQNDKFGSTNSWWGSALYLNADFSKTFGLTLRTELFDDSKQLNVFSNATGGGSIFANTLSANIRLGGLILIPEFRIEKVSKPIFIDGKSSNCKMAANALIAAVYAF